jgi:hypothetical protein
MLEAGFSFHFGTEFGTETIFEPGVSKIRRTATNRLRLLGFRVIPPGTMVYFVH